MDASAAQGIDAHWPASPESLVAHQAELAQATPPRWQPRAGAAVGASYCCFTRDAPAPGASGERGWGSATRKAPGHRAVAATVEGCAGWAYTPGLLALREGQLREAALRRLDPLPDVVLVDATGRDHPRGAGLALQLGAVLGVPTVGVTDRPLAAEGPPPADRRGARSPLRLDGQVVGYWLRARFGVKPVAVHAAWRTDAETAADVVASAARKARTPQPLREARRAARGARSAASPT